MNQARADPRVTAFTVGGLPNRILRISLAGLCLAVCLISPTPCSRATRGASTW